MPTYDELLISQAPTYAASGAQLERIGAQVLVSNNEVQAEFTGKCSPPNWVGQSQQAAVEYVRLNSGYAQRAGQGGQQAAVVLEELAAQLEPLILELQTLRASITAQGFLIEEGIVLLGPPQYAEIAAANVGAPAVEAAYLAEAAALTAENEALVAQANAIDLAAAQRLAQIAFELGADVTDLPFGPVGALDTNMRAALQSQVAATRQRLTALGRQVQNRRVVGGARYDINGQSGSYDSVSGHQLDENGNNFYPGTLDRIPPGQRTYDAFSPPNLARGSDAENKIFERLNQQFPANATGRVWLYTEQEPCPACRQMIAQFQRSHPGIQIFLGWS